MGSDTFVGKGGRAVPRVLVVGGGFVGFHALRALERRVGDRAELVLVSPRDYLLYSPLLPDVATGAVGPTHVAVPLRQHLRRTRAVLGNVVSVDMTDRTATVEEAGPGRGDLLVLGWDRLVLAPGSVTRQFDIPGVAENAKGFKTLTEAVYLHDHVLQQLDLADSCPDTAAGRAERRERLTVVAVGAGYTGTEFVAQMQLWLRTVAGRWDRTGADDVNWLLVDVAPAVLPELGPALGSEALRVLRARGVDVRLGVTVARATAHTVELTDGSLVPSRTLVWGAGVAANPLVATLGLPTERGRLTVDAQMRVPGVQDVWAAGDAASVPDLAAGRGSGGRPVPAPPTAQHAQRQGKALARNVGASLGVGKARPYRHRDLGLVADLGGGEAVARPLGLSLTGWPAKAVTRGYHLYALPGAATKARVATDWVLGALLPSSAVQLSLVREQDASIGAAQATGIYGPQGSTVA